MNMRKLLIVVAATPAFVTGTQNLMNDAMTWVLILIPIRKQRKSKSITDKIHSTCYRRRLKSRREHCRLHVG